jgi:predicted peptidase
MKLTLGSAMWWCLWLVVVLATGCSVDAAATPTDTAAPVESPLPYLAYLPQGYDSDPDKRWPLIVYLHTADLRGDHTLDAVRLGGLPAVLESARSLPELRDNFIVIAPQCPAGSDWETQIDNLSQMLDEVETLYRVDPDRIALTGASMGGFGVWAWGSAEPDRFSALAPISGSGEPPADLCVLRDAPVWIVHGEDDPDVPSADARAMADALQACGGSPLLTIYPGVRHNAWTRTYQDSDFYVWLLAQGTQ